MPATMDELKETVKDIASTVPEQVIQGVVGNYRKRCNACERAYGNHFESFLCIPIITVLNSLSSDSFFFYEL